MTIIKSRGARGEKMKHKTVDVEVQEADETFYYLYRWVQTAVVRSPTDLAEAIEFGKGLAADLAERYERKVEFSIDVFGQRVYWQMEYNSMDEIQELKTSLLDDEDYINAMTEHRELWKDNSFTETVISVLSAGETEGEDEG